MSMVDPDASLFEDYLDIPQIAKLVGVQPSAVKQWRIRRLECDFPVPDVSRWPDKPLWHRKTILDWHKWWVQRKGKGAPGLPRKRRAESRDIEDHVDKGGAGP